MNSMHARHVLMSQNTPTIDNWKLAYATQYVFHMRRTTIDIRTHRPI